MLGVERQASSVQTGRQCRIDRPQTSNCSKQTKAATTSGNHILTPLKNDVGYRYDDFEPIGQLVAATIILAVPADSEWQTLDDLVEAARAEPGKYTFVRPLGDFQQSSPD